MPKMGKLVRNNGNNAQCIAQAKEVAIPKKSKLTFIVHWIREQMYANATVLQNNKAVVQKPHHPNFVVIIILWEKNSLVIYSSF